MLMPSNKPRKENAGPREPHAGGLAANFTSMFFTMTKVLQSLVLPPAGCLILMAVGFLVVRSSRVIGRLLIASGFILLYLAAISPMTDLLMHPLEKDYPELVTKRTKIEAQAIVVLSAGVRDRSWLGLDPEPSEGSLERMVTGVILWRTTGIPLIVVGGNGDPAKTGVSEAAAMAKAALRLGVPAKEITIESSARNTLESARAVKRMVPGGRIILATSAYHMKRAAAMFRKQGFAVVPAPAGYRGGQRTITPFSFIPGAENLHYSSCALAEYLGLAWYFVNGDL
jgi:uncharacterized SAM-binding protein YcdF (DUF218 family)